MLGKVNPSIIEDFKVPVLYAQKATLGATALILT